MAVVSAVRGDCAGLFDTRAMFQQWSHRTTLMPARRHDRDGT
jgi:hypothetical protein